MRCALLLPALLLASGATALAQELGLPTSLGAPQEPAPPQDREVQAEDLARKLTNPVAAMISIQLQTNFDFKVGPLEEGFRYTANVLPTLPLSLSDDWNLISRTNLSIIYQQEIFPGADTQIGFADVVQSFFFSPAEPGPLGLIWGVGPAFRLVTGTDDLLSSKKWGAGPTAGALRQDGPWTYGALVNHIYAGMGTGQRPDISSTYLQPFVSYTTKDAWTLSLNTESTYNWKNHEWSVPLNLGVSKMATFSGTPVSLSFGIRYWADTTDSGPHDLGFRFALTLLLPK